LLGLGAILLYKYNTPALAVNAAGRAEPEFGGSGYTKSTAMAYIREIITDGHPTLRKVAKKVDPAEIADPIFQQQLDDMFETMYAAPGIGLAAPQIGISKRIFTVDLQDEDDEKNGGPFVVINPKFTETEGEVEAIEGCLSVPGMVGEMTRFQRVVCVGLDRHGKRIKLEGEGLFARCLQHEMDHLNGILYIDKAKNVRKAQTEEEVAEAEAVAAGAR
jgi:peptide deformylase